MSLTDKSKNTSFLYAKLPPVVKTWKQFRELLYKLHNKDAFVIFRKDKLLIETDGKIITGSWRGNFISSFNLEEAHPEEALANSLYLLQPFFIMIDYLVGEVRFWYEGNYTLESDRYTVIVKTIDPYLLNAPMQMFGLPYRFLRMDEYRAAWLNA